MRIVITGGHPAPALAVIHELLVQKHTDIHFIGRQFAVDEGVAESYEYKQIKKLDLPFYHLQTGRLTRVWSYVAVRNFLRIFSGMYESYKLLSKIKPDVVMSFGGFIGLPVCIMARFMEIHVITHEQTISPGLANKIIGKFADQILLAFPETMKYFDVKKTRVTGNPMREEALHVVKKPFSFTKTKPVLYITGGSLGAHSINAHVENILERLLKKFIIIHQVGNVEEYKDFERLSQLKRKNYFVVAHLSTDEVGWVFKTADIVVSRGGANTTFELIYFKKPCVIIPLPWSGSNEQEQHGKLFAHSGAGEIFYQSHPSNELYNLIMKINADMPSYKKNFALLQKYLYPDATKNIVTEILGN
jgi:UDP-N-acetylglucosamine--N-acetylmuramyl-(pentapeptide) pyrophosphoryl-undecaprenol N-acetylglucosamine transferase